MILFKNVVLFLGILASLYESPKADDEALDSFPGSFNRFAKRMYFQLAIAKPTENIIFSPLSLQTALVMAYAGAEQETANEMANNLDLLGFHKPDIIRIFGNFLRNATAPERDTKYPGTRINFANRMYADQNLKISSRFREIVKNNFNAQVEKVNFLDGTTAEKINRFIKDQTDNKIRKFIKESELEFLTNTVLIDALSFKGKWQYAFRKQDTKPIEFKINSQEKVLVDMMFLSGKFNYADLPDFNAQALELPFENSQRKMLILLPYEEKDIDQVKLKTNPEILTEIFSKLQPQDVCVHLPKFRLEEENDFKEPLKKLGMSSMFSPKANFSSMFDAPTESYISAVKQKVFLEIDEDGVEQSASTEGTANCLLRSSRILFYADRPFIFAIRQGRAIYFAGKIGRP